MALAVIIPSQDDPSAFLIPVRKLSLASFFLLCLLQLLSFKLPHCRTHGVIIRLSQWQVLDSLHWWDGQLPPWPCRCWVIPGLYCGPSGNVVAIFNATGSIPTEIGNLRELRRLDLTRTNITGSIPNTTSRLRKLTYLDLGINRLTGTLPEGLFALRRLKFMNLGTNFLTGSIPSTVSQMRKLKDLSLFNNHLSGSLPQGMSALKRLTYLSLSLNYLTGTIPSTMSQMRNLEYVNMFINQLSGSLPLGMTVLRRLTKLDLAGNSLTGSIPSAVSQMRNLVFLSFAANMLSGSLPQGMSALTRLKYLFVDHNELSGSIPQGMSALKRLSMLDVSDNQLDGAIPAWLGNFIGLFHLSLSRNEFSGTMSDDAFNLPALQRLGIGDLQVTGPIPQILSSLTSLTYLDAGYSRFTGNVPSLHISDKSRIYLQGNFFRSYSPNFLSGVCNYTGNTTIYVDSNCLPIEPSSRYCNQSQRSEDTCNVICSNPCPGIDACYVMDSNVPACPCGATQYISALNPGTCTELSSVSTSFCLSPSNIFLQSLRLKGSASVSLGGISFSRPFRPPPLPLGSAFLPSPISLFSDDTCNSSLTFSSSFTINMHKAFQIRDRTPSARRPKGGLTFALLASPPSPSYTPGSLGYAGTGVGLAVEFDTSQEPWDPSNNHVGINAGGSVKSIATADPPFLLTNGQPTYVWVNFDGSYLDVFVAQGNASKPSNPLLSYAVDLCMVLRPQPLTSGLQRFYVGFTAQNDWIRQSQRVSDWCWTTSIPTTRSYGLAVQPSAILPSGRGNRFSRYTSCGYSPALDGSDSWLIKSYVTWILPAWLPPVHDQGGCGACWAYATVDSIASAYAILANKPSASPPLLSATQLFNSPVDSFSNCSSSCPATALQYVADISAAGGGLLEDGKNLPYPIESFERVSFYGWFGLLLAVQHQPVIVHIQADAESFKAHNGRYVYNDESCYSYNLNHVVLVVGYLIAGQERNGFLPPFWILKNSWGSEWGDQGFMRMGITGGDGICGINVLPGLYPVIKSASDPCLSSSLPSSNSVPSLNPCGGFTCDTDKVNPATNTCNCTLPFVQVTNADGSRTCAYVNRCFSVSTNPCKVGTCRNTGDGFYTCICPHGFYLGTTYDGSPSCAPSDYSITTTFYTIVTTKTSADDIAGAFGISLPDLKLNNPKVDFDHPLIPTVINVTARDPRTPCSVFYTVVSGDSCTKIGKLFSLSVATFAYLNPGINCSAISNGSITCVERNAAIPAAAIATVPCSQPYIVQSTDTCDSVRLKTKKLNLDDPLSPPGALSWQDFYRYNPGINCDNLFPPTLNTSPVELCLDVSSSFSQGTCKNPKCQTLVLSEGDTCSYLMGKYFSNSPSRWSRCNPQFSCVEPIKGNKRSVCVPKPT